MFKQLKLLALPSIYIYETAIFVRSNPKHFEHVRRERRRDQLCLMICKTALFRNSVFAMALIVYNKIPKSIRDSDDLNIFKNLLYKFLTDKTYYTVKEFLNDKSVYLNCFWLDYG